MILFFDTETTGFRNFRMPPEHEDQVSIVQLAAALFDEDGTIASKMAFITRPGRLINKKAAEIHGITDGIAQFKGIDLGIALAAFAQLCERADTLVAHNIKFDLGIIECAAARTGTDVELPPEHICTMEMTREIINLPPTDQMLAAGRTEPKPPKLSECIEHFFNEELEGAHDALIDVEACARVFFHVRAMQ